MQSMAQRDAFFLRGEKGSNFLHTLKMAVFDPTTADHRIDFEQTKRVAKAQLPLILPFRRIPLEPPFPLAPYLWIETDSFEDDYHFQHVTLESPGGREQLNRVMNEVMSTPLRRDRPLWQFYYIDGLPDGKLAYLLKIHHAVADGSVIAAIMEGVMQQNTDAFKAPPDTVQIDLTRWADPLPSRATRIRYAIGPALRTLASIPVLALHSVLHMVKDIRRSLKGEKHSVMFQCPDTPFNRNPTVNRIIDHISLPFDEIKQVKNAFNCSINDVYLTVIGGALRHYLQQRGELTDRSLNIVVPVSDREPGEGVPIFGNAVSSWVASCGSGIADPEQRLRAVMTGTRHARDDFAHRDTVIDRGWLEFWPLSYIMTEILPAAAAAVVGRPSFNVIASNVRGPNKALYSDGALLDAIYSVGPINNLSGLNITAWSYNGQFNVLMQASIEHVPDLDVIADAFLPELEKLVQAAQAL
jgi:WS/DGAT/MGAT family acyltransferase